MLSRRANFTFQKPKSNELSLIPERINLKRHRSRSNKRNTFKYHKASRNDITQKKLLKMINDIEKILIKNDDDDESKPDDEDESISLLEIIQKLFTQRGNVFREGNHIYFRSEVTQSSVNELCDLIQQINDEHSGKREQCDPIYLHITSMGGDLFAGFLAFDFIKNSNVPVYTIADGFAVSSGANMFMAGKKRFMRKHSYLLIHQLNQFRQENETALNALDNAENVSEFMSKLYDIYLDNIRHNRENVPETDVLTKEKLKLLMHHDKFWNYDTCLRYGLVDGLYTNTYDLESLETKNSNINPLLSLFLPTSTASTTSTQSTQSTQTKK